MRAVITGSAGFIGSTLAERLVAEGWWVTGIDSFSPFYAAADKEANLAALVGERRFDLVRADVATMSLDRVLADRPLIVHLAAQPGVLGSFGTGFDQYLHDNLLATQRLFEAAAEAGCPRVVYASSSSVYGDAEAYPCYEDATPTRPRSPYGVTKRAGEKLAEVYAGMGLPTVGMRYFTVYGPRQRPDMAIRRLCEAATGGRVPVDRQAAQIGDVWRTAGDTSRARACLGWRPRVSLRDGLRAELDWVRERREAEIALVPTDISLIAGRAS